MPFYPLNDEVLRKIVELKLSKIPAVFKRTIADVSVHSGSSRPYCQTLHRSGHRWRNIDHIITKTLLPELSGEVLSRMADGKTIRSVGISVTDEGAFRYESS